jgi:hypothetical protein
MAWMQFLYVSISFSFLSAVFAQEPCGSLQEGYGPYDYINPKHRTENKGHHLNIVERHHFTFDVERLRRGSTSPAPGADIDYTLRAWPNHHRALISATKLALKSGKEKPPGMRYTIDCWFDRAIRMNSQDPMVRAIYATYLAKRGRKNEAVDNAERANEMGGGNRKVQYMIATAYTDVKEYPKAVHHAKRALELGYPLQGVKDRLVALGVWVD